MKKRVKKKENEDGMIMKIRNWCREHFSKETRRAFRPALCLVVLGLIGATFLMINEDVDFLTALYWAGPTFLSFCSSPVPAASTCLNLPIRPFM